MKKYSILAAILVVFVAISLAYAKEQGRAVGQEHRSSVSNIVQKLTDIAGKDSNIGVEVREVAKEQEDSAKRAEEAMDKVEKTGKFRTFFIGTDYKNIGAVRSELVTTQNAINRLTKAMERATNVDVKAELQKQIDALKAIKAKAEVFIKDHEGQFSILGWVVRLFSK